MIELKNINFSYNTQDHPVLTDINLIVDQQKIGIIGDNGCGKTTLLKIIIGLLKVSDGELLLDGRAIKTEADLVELRKQVGFLFQNSDDQLFSPTVLEDVAFGPLNLGFSPQEAKSISMEMLARLGLDGFENKLTHKLSGGEKKLVALATTLSMKPKVLLLDEPTNNLDPNTRRRLINVLKDLDQSCIIVSHDWDFLEATTSELYSIDHGKMFRCQHDHLHSHPHIHSYGDHPHSHGN